jgi:hypothetical protein
VFCSISRSFGPLLLLRERIHLNLSGALQELPRQPAGTGLESFVRRGFGAPVFVSPFNLEIGYEQYHTHETI